MSSRRQFIKNSTHLIASSGLIAAVPASIPTIRTASTPPSDTIVVGLIGCRGMGFGDLRNHLQLGGVECGGLCDVDSSILEERAADVENISGKRPPVFTDFRELLDEKDIDAVIIGTPDHWHCLQTVYACQAGKDVYVEKPMANSIAECDLIVEAARTYNRVIQVGQQQRSGKHWQDVVAFVQSGKLADIRQVKVWANFEYGKGLPRVADETPPPYLNYDLYLGPAPVQPYNPSRIHGGWRHQWNFGGGLMTDWGVHLLDIVLWAMQVNRSPASVSASGGIYSYSDRAIETPDTLNVIYQLDGFTLTWEHLGGIQAGTYGRNYGIAFIGNNGTLIVNRAGWEVVPGIEENNYKMDPFPPKRGQQSNHLQHAKDFVEAIKDRKDPICTVEMGRDAAFFAHLGNIAHRTNSRIVWDESKNRFVDNAIADKLIKPDYRTPWKWPEL